MIKTSFRHRNKSKNALVSSPLFLLLSRNPFHMNISHLLLCTSLLAAPVCAAQGLTETETETPASASRLPAPLAQKIASGDFDGLQTELRSTLLKAGEQTKSEQKLLQNRQYRHLLDMHEFLRVTGPDKVKAVFSKSAPGCRFHQNLFTGPGVDGALSWSGPDSGKFTGRPSNPFRHLENGRARARISGITNPWPPDWPLSFPPAP